MELQRRRGSTATATAFAATGCTVHSTSPPQACLETASLRISTCRGGHLAMAETRPLGLTTDARPVAAGGKPTSLQWILHPAQTPGGEKDRRTRERWDRRDKRSTSPQRLVDTAANATVTPNDYRRGQILALHVMYSSTDYPCPELFLLDLCENQHRVPGFWAGAVQYLGKPRPPPLALETTAIFSINLAHAP